LELFEEISRRRLIILRPSSFFKLFAPLLLLPLFNVIK
jgi:hypothetical protein